MHEARPADRRAPPGNTERQPLISDVLVHRTSDTTLNQIVGGDLAGLVLVVPVTLVAAVLCWLTTALFTPLFAAKRDAPATRQPPARMLTP